MKKFILILSVIISTVAFAKEKKHRHHEAHQHGAGTLGIAFDNAKGKLDLKIPSESIIGFEYTPKSDKDKLTKQKQLDKLEKNIAEIIAFDVALKCNIKKDKIDVVKDEEESKEAGSEHSDISASFDITCEKSPLGTGLVFNFQTYFPKIKDLDVQIIVNDLQKSIEAKKSRTRVELK